MVIFSNGRELVATIVVQSTNQDARPTAAQTLDGLNRRLLIVLHIRTVLTTRLAMSQLDRHIG